MTATAPLPPRGFNLSEDVLSSLRCESCDRFYTWGPGQGSRCGLESMPVAVGFAAIEHTRAHDLERRVEDLSKTVRALTDTLDEFLRRMQSVSVLSVMTGIGRAKSPMATLTPDSIAHLQSAGAPQLKHVEYTCARGHAFTFRMSPDMMTETQCPDCDGVSG